MWLTLYKVGSYNYFTVWTNIIMHIIHYITLCTEYIPYVIIQWMNYALCTSSYTVFKKGHQLSFAQFPLPWIIPYVICTIHYLLCITDYVICTIHYLLCIIHYVLYTIHYILCTYYVLCTIHYMKQNAIGRPLPRFLPKNWIN